VKKIYSFKAKVWLYPSNAAWHFVTLPQDDAKDINYYFGEVKRGWGSLPVTVTLGATSWKTSIFPDKESRSYLLPLKAQVRKKEGVKEGDEISLLVEITSTR
jgi:hypothetical protein